MQILVCYELGLNNGGALLVGHAYCTVSELTRSELDRIHDELFEEATATVRSKIPGKLVFRSVVPLHG